MSHYTIEELIARWKREELSVEQVIGQLLVLHAQQQQLRVLACRPCDPPDASPMVRRAR